jgi:molybdate transport system substrate-binding protein
LTDAVDEAARVYTDSTGTEVETRFGASGMLAAALVQGAPADIFISADAAWMEHLAGKKLLVEGSARILAWNRLCVVVPAGVDTLVPLGPVDMLKLRRIAIGDPGVVPAGRYAQQALTHLGLWDLMGNRFILGPDARAVLALVERGEVDGAVVYESDAKASKRVRIGFLIPEESHDPVAYPGSLLQGARHREAAQRFLDFLSGPRGRAIFIAHGLQGT